MARAWTFDNVQIGLEGELGHDLEGLVLDALLDDRPFFYSLSLWERVGVRVRRTP